MRPGAALAALLLAACAAPDPLPPHQATPAFDPAAFFAGRSHGDGLLDPLVGASKPIRVDSFGRSRRGGGFVLVQRIREGDKPPRIRSWSVRQISPGRWSGSLSDAQGPVTLASDGNRLTIAYTMPGGIAVDQRLILAADGRVARNRMRFTRWGLTLATLDETIRKLD